MNKKLKQFKRFHLPDAAFGISCVNKELYVVCATALVVYTQAGKRLKSIRIPYTVESLDNGTCCSDNGLLHTLSFSKCSSYYDKIIYFYS